MKELFEEDVADMLVRSDIYIRRIVDELVDKGEMYGHDG
jgi:hypothetical protein